MADETYSADNISLIEISGTSVHNNKAEQVDHVATSLDSGHSFVLQTTSSLFIWHGSQCPFELQQSAVKVAEFLKVCSSCCADVCSISVQLANYILPIYVIAGRYFETR